MSDSHDGKEGRSSPHPFKIREGWRKGRRYARSCTQIGFPGVEGGQSFWMPLAQTKGKHLWGGLPKAKRERDS